MLRPALAAFLLTIASSAAHAQVVVAERDFSEQRAEIEADLADGRTYAEISPADRARVRESLDRMAGLLEGAGSVDELAQEEKVDLFNHQEQVNTLLTRAAEDSRLVCDHSRATGSHHRTTKCQTVAERRRRMEADQQHLQRMQNGIGPANN